MAQETIQVGWLKDNEGNKFSPKTLASQVITDEGNLIDSLNDRYITAGQVEEVPIGERATAEGYNNQAIGKRSHAEGAQNIAYGTESHVEGVSGSIYNGESKTPEEIVEAWENGHIDKDGDEIPSKQLQAAIGRAAHAEGANNLAIGNFSHVEGVQNKAYIGGHAEGQYNVANTLAHAEGNKVKGWGQCSHAEGSQTFTKGYYSHAEGYGGSEWEPYNADGSEKSEIEILDEWNNQQNINKRIHGAVGGCSHVEGGANLAYGSYSHAEGSITKAEGHVSHSENYKTQSIGNFSHAGGDGAIANSVGSFAHGNGVQTGGKMLLLTQVNLSNGVVLDEASSENNNRSTIQWTTDQDLSNSSLVEGERIKLYYKYSGISQSSGPTSYLIQYDNTTITLACSSSSTSILRDQYSWFIYASVPFTFSADYSTALGIGTYTSLNGQLVTGTYNTPNQDSLFIVGNGSDAEDRSNAFEVKTDGTVVAGTFDGNATSATKLQTSRTVRTNLSSTSSASFNGTSSITPGVTGTLSLAHGGTGATTAAAARTNLGAQATITGAATTITESDLTTDKVLVSDSAGKVAASPITSTELEHLSGVTSNIQTQLNSLIKNLQDSLSGYGSAQTSSIVIEDMLKDTALLETMATAGQNMSDEAWEESKTIFELLGWKKKENINTTDKVSSLQAISFNVAALTNNVSNNLGVTSNDTKIAAMLIYGLAMMGINRSDTLTNSASGVGALAIGADNISAGLGSLAVGYKAQAGDPNDLESMQSPGQTAIGWNVKATGDGALAFGRDTEASGNYSAAIGYGVKATGKRSFAFGSDHDLTQASDSHDYIKNFFTNYNRINNTSLTSFDFDGSHGDHSATFGSNKVEGTNTFTAGHELWAAGECNAVFGQLNTVANDCTKVLMSGASNSAQTMHSSIIGGQMNDIRNTYDIVAVGDGLKIDGGKTSVIGKYNKHDVNDLFEIGNGDDASSRSNAFAVTSTGAIAHGKNVTASGKYSYAGGDNAIASGIYSHAEGQSTEATHPGAHAEGTATKAYNNGAHAEGWYGKAEGDCAHVEGWETGASGNAAHAEGQKTIANGPYSHAEGGETQATAIRSHAEGYKTIASYNEAHAEGEGSEARAWASHAEGAYCIAGANCSHAGGVRTETNTEGQTAIGKWNALDANALFIVGNGSESARSNAFTVNKDGTATLGADPTLKMHAATKQYVDVQIAAAAAGLLKRVVVDTLPTTNIDTNTIYMIPGAGAAAIGTEETEDTKDEFMYIDDAWELIGNTRVDLSDYVTNTSLSTTLNNYLPVSGGTISGSLTLDNGYLAMTTADPDCGITLVPWRRTDGTYGLQILGTNDELVELTALADPTYTYSAVNKNYVDNHFLKLPENDRLYLDYTVEVSQTMLARRCTIAGSLIAEECSFMDCIIDNLEIVDSMFFSVNDIGRTTRISITPSLEEPSQNGGQYQAVLDFNGQIDPSDTSPGHVSLRYVILNELILRNNSLNYGTTLPVAQMMEGQVYFKVVS